MCQSLPNSKEEFLETILTDLTRKFLSFETLNSLNTILISNNSNSFEKTEFHSCFFAFQIISNLLESFSENENQKFEKFLKTFHFYQNSNQAQKKSIFGNLMTIILKLISDNSFHDSQKIILTDFFKFASKMEFNFLNLEKYLDEKNFEAFLKIVGKDFVDLNFERSFEDFGDKKNEKNVFFCFKKKKYGNQFSRKQKKQI